MLYVRLFLVMGVSLYTSRVVLAQLGVTDYGIYNVVGGIVVMLSFLNGAMSQSTQRFLSYEIGQRNEDRLQAVFKTAFTIHIFIGAVILILSETVGLWFLNNVMKIPSSQLSAANVVYQCSIAGFILSIFQAPLKATIIARERMHVYAWLGLLEVCFKLAVAFSLAFFPHDKMIYMALMTMGLGIMFFIFNAVYCRHYFPECRFGIYFERKLMLPMAGFASWATMGSFTWVWRVQGCNLILNLFFGPAINAAFGIANKVNMAVSAFVQNFNIAMNPQITKTYSAGSFDEMERLIIFGTKLSFFLTLLISFPILLTTEWILNLWLTDVPQYTVIFTRLVIINTLLESFIHSIAAGVNATGRIKWYQIIVSLSMLLVLPLSYFALRAGYPPYTIFIITIALTILTAVERLAILKRTIAQFSVSRFIKIAVIPASLITCVAILFYFGLFQLIHNLHPIIAALGGAALIALLEITIGLNRYERYHLCTFLRRIISRKPELRC